MIKDFFEPITLAKRAHQNVIDNMPKNQLASITTDLNKAFKPMAELMEVSSRNIKSIPVIDMPNFKSLADEIHSLAIPLSSVAKNAAELQRSMTSFAELINTQTKPIVEAIDRMNRGNDRLFQLFRSFTETFQSLQLSPFANSWLNSLQDIPVETDTVTPKTKLIEFKNDQIRYKNSYKTPRKINSLHLILLLCLLEKADENGITSYETIYEYMELSRLDKHLRRKKVLDTKREIFRFFNIQENYNGIPIIQVVPGVGLKLYNPYI